MSIPIGTGVLLEAVLLLLTAFFSAGMTALDYAGESKMKTEDDAPAEGFKQAIRLYAHSSYYQNISGMMLCLCLSFAGICAAESFFAPLKAWLEAVLQLVTSDWLALLITVLLLVMIWYVFGIRVPQRMARQNAEKTLARVAPLFLFFGGLLWPLHSLNELVARGVLWLLGIRTQKAEEEVTEEDIRMMVDMGGETGAIEQDERTMIENIFEFNNSTAEDIMIHRIDVVFLRMDDTPAEILQTIEQSGLSRFPVCGNDIDDVVGILNTRDFLLNLQKKTPRPLKALLRPAYMVPETVPADTLFKDMQKKKVHLAIVVDEYGGMAGIVTMEDLLEEIVGNIYDEFDPKEEAEIEKIGENLWRVKGTADLEELSETLGVDLPLDEEFDTLGGMIFSEFSSIPEDGSKPVVDMYGLHIQVENIVDHRVESALISKL